MKRLSQSMGWVLALSLLATACIPQRTPPAANTAPRLRVGVDETLPPFAQAGSDAQNPAGFEIDVIKDLTAGMKVEVEFVNADDIQVLMFVSQCQLDAGIAALTISDALKTTMDFTEPYYTTGQVVVVKEGNIVIGGKDDLSGMKVGTQDGTLSAVELKKIPGAEVIEYATFPLAFKDLVNGFIDAVVSDQARALSYVKTRRNNLKIVGAPFGRAEFGIAVCREQPELVEQFNTNLAAMKESGRLERLVKKWGIPASSSPLE